MGRRTGRRGRVRGGSVIRPHGKAGPQIVDSRGARWTDAHEARFLDELGASCNVTRSARAVGFSTVSVYNRRRTDAGFAERWRAALVQGYVRVEMALIQRATEAAEGRPPDPALPLPAMTIKEALALLKMHRAEVTGAGKPYGRRPAPRSLEQVRASILAKVEAFETMRRVGDHGV